MTRPRPHRWLQAGFNIALVAALLTAISFLPPDTSLADRQRSGVLKVCVPATYPPLITGNPAEPGYDAELVKVEPRNRFPEDTQVGMQFEGMPDSGDGDEAMIFTITDIADDKVVLDGNHPLAGMALRFDLNVTEVRAASDEEIAHGHVHGAHGHGHHDDDDDEEGGEFRSIQVH